MSQIISKYVPSGTLTSIATKAYTNQLKTAAEVMVTGRLDIFIILVRETYS